MAKDAGEVIEEIFAAGEADEATAAVSPALRELWAGHGWSAQAIEAAALHASETA